MGNFTECDLSGEIVVPIIGNVQPVYCDGCETYQRARSTPMQHWAALCCNPKSLWYLRLAHCKCERKEVAK